MIKLRNIPKTTKIAAASNLFRMLPRNARIIETLTATKKRGDAASTSGVPSRCVIIVAGGIGPNKLENRIPAPQRLFASLAAQSKRAHADE
jgi:hypothetical protein